MEIEEEREREREREKGRLPSPKKEDRLPPGRLKKEARELLCLPWPPPKMEETPWPPRDREGERERERDFDFLLRSTVYFFRPSCERRETTETESLSQKPIFLARSLLLAACCFVGWCLDPLLV